MNFPLSGVIVNPQGVSTSVMITDDTGATATVYSDRFAMSPVSMPATISSTTTYYLPGEGPWTVTPTVDGSVLAGQTVRLEGAQVATVTVPVTAARATQLGAYVPVSTTQPSNPAVTPVYVDTSGAEPILRQWDGTTYVQMVSIDDAAGLVFALGGN